MTARQEAFIRAYIETGNEREAAIRAGYSAKTASQQASRLLAMPEIQHRRVELERELYEKIGVSEAWVGRRLVEIVERCMQATPHLEWNPETREKEPDGYYVFDARGATTALGKIGESLGMFKQAEKERGEMSVVIKLTDEEESK